MTWVVKKIADWEMYYLVNTEMGDDRPIIKVTGSFKEQEELCKKIAHALNFCKGYEDERLEAMGSLEGVEILTTVQVEGLSSMFHEVVEDSQSQIQLLKSVYVGLCDAMALTSFQEVHRQIQKIETYAEKESIKL